MNLGHLLGMTPLYSVRVHGKPDLLIMAAPRVLSPQVPTGRPQLLGFPIFCKVWRNSQEEPGRGASRGFLERATMFGLAGNHKALVSQLSDSLCSQGLARDYNDG